MKYGPSRKEWKIRLAISVAGLGLLAAALWLRGLPEGPGLVEVVGVAGLFFGLSALAAIRGAVAMTPWLIVQAVVFAIWVVLAFRSLFRLLALMRARTGQMLPGLREGMAAPLLFLREPQFQHDRRLLAVLTVVLLMLSAAFAATR